MDLFPDAFETERLRYERLDAAMDAFECYEHMGTDEFERLSEHISKDRHHHPKDSLDYLEESAEKWREGDRANWAMFPRDGEGGAGEFAGVASLIPLWDRRTARLGVWLLEEYQGRGYAGERADALIALAFDRLDLELVAAGHTDANDASRKAIERYVERYGGEYEGVLRNWVVLDDEPRDLHRYSISAAEYDEAGVDVDLAVEETLEE
ncbi:GNAT family N-acetyltransferase [Halorubellus sp. JP-L1]|uniref:GNAT family N-acetyltransferase n=1 Tax=Halorubellus sp. JP-L1 TaxID=2715753 RepID=UPI00140873A5|nr:GNAT family protein [Halorubellus sp. JP-L1]NHN41199.1 GNAT family N-acetyltransferase [Halorubellus sp. JP-L1]